MTQTMTQTIAPPGTLFAPARANALAATLALIFTALPVGATPAATPTSAAPPPAAAPAITECDRRAAHPEDQQRVAPGVERGQIDLPVAIAACEQAVSAAPADARQRYQLARLLFYAGQNARAVDEMRRAADGGYPQAQFVYGTFVVRGRPGAPTDVCVAERYWRGSADGGRQAARIQYLRHALKGRFDGCAGRLDDAQLKTLLDTASRDARDFYERLLVEDLTEALAARTASAR
jgi:TPR repeat protein